MSNIEGIHLYDYGQSLYYSFSTYDLSAYKMDVASMMLVHVTVA
jgi:hypothetical protein